MPSPTSDREFSILRGPPRGRFCDATFPRGLRKGGASRLIRADAEEFESLAQEWGYRIGTRSTKPISPAKSRPAAFAAFSWFISMSPGSLEKSAQL